MGFFRSLSIVTFSAACFVAKASESIDVLEARHFPSGDRIVAIPGVLEPKAPDEYRLNYDDSTGHSKILSVHLDHVEEGIALLKGLKVVVNDGTPKAKVALALRLVADLTETSPQLKMAVQFISGASGTAIVPVENCSDASDQFPTPPSFRELPDWKEVRVLYPWSGFQGRTQKVWAHGTLFLHSAAAASFQSLIPMVDVVYEEWDATGEARNQKRKVSQHDAMEAYSILALSERGDASVRVNLPGNSHPVKAIAKAIVIDLHEDTPEVKLAFEVSLSGKTEERILPVSAVKGFEKNCASSLIQ